MTPSEPQPKRTHAFVDGQALFHAAKLAFGYHYPNYDALLLAQSVCRARGWTLTRTYFYTGVPDAIDKPFWNHFWTAKLALLGTRGVITFSRSLRYQERSIQLPDGRTVTGRIGQEKGIDVRLALDVVRLARENAYDVALIFSQDQDLSEVADEVRAIARDHARWIKVACAFPMSDMYDNKRGVNKTDWIPIDRTVYDSCIDQIDYRPKFKK